MYRIRLLKSYNFDFEKNEYIFLKSKENYFPNKVEKNDYQRKYLKNEIILLMLDEKPYKEAIKELLQSSYSDRASSLKKTREADKFGLLANNFLSLLDPHSSYFSKKGFRKLESKNEFNF